MPAAKQHRRKARPDHDHDELVADAEFRRQIGNPSKMSVWRYDHGNRTPEHWPARIEVNGRFFRSQRATDKYKNSLVAAANTQFAERIELRRRRGYRTTVELPTIKE